MAKYLVDDLIKALADGADLERALEGQKLLPETVMKWMSSARGKSQLKARRRLAHIHSKLVAHRFSAFAVQKLCQLLSDEKPELRLKGALSILQLAGLGEKPARGAKKKGAAAEEERAATPEDEEVISALAEVLRRRRGNEEAGK